MGRREVRGEGRERGEERERGGVCKPSGDQESETMGESWSREE